MKAKHERACASLLRGLPPLLDAEGYVANNCILSSRLAVDALQQAGVKAKALACRVIAFSPEMVAHLDAGGSPMDPDAPGWNVAIGYPNQDAGEGYNGHVVVLADNELVLDFSVGQMSRPKYGMNLTPGGFDVTPEFLAGEEPRVFMAGESMLSYEAMPDRKDFMTAPDWCRTLQKEPGLVAKVRQMALA